jgi:hypothetical protein
LILITIDAIDVITTFSFHFFLHAFDYILLLLSLPTLRCRFMIAFHVPWPLRCLIFRPTHFAIDAFTFRFACRDTPPFR